MISQETFDSVRILVDRIRDKIERTEGFRPSEASIVIRAINELYMRVVPEPNHFVPKKD